jgi:hypothetical protein
MKLSKDNIGAMGSKMLVVFVLILALVLAMISGLVDINLPSPLEGEYSQIVNRGTTDIGIRVPIQVELTFSQDATDGSKSIVDVNIKHKHEALGSDDNYVPDPKLVSVASFNLDVGNVGDTKTIYGVNGHSFKASNVTYNSSLMSLANTNFGTSQTNYKVWTTSVMHSPSLSNDNSALLVQTVWKHYRKATNELLSADTVNWVVYYKMPTYNADDTYTSTYNYYVYVPFNDYAGDPTNSALVEDINWEVRGYFEHCVIEWTTVTLVTHEYWDFPLLNKFFPSASSTIKLVRSRDSTLATAIQYSWTGPTDISINNDNQYGSHTYQYKIR